MIANQQQSVDAISACMRSGGHLMVAHWHLIIWVYYVNLMTALWTVVCRRAQDASEFRYQEAALYFEHLLLTRVLKSEQSPTWLLNSLLYEGHA